jgi:uncharacterized protein (DUF2225 family)
MADILYTTKKACVVCGQQFTVTKTRNRLSMVKQDSDFCTHYKEINPYYYVVWVCPHCGYAAQDTFFEETPGKIEAIQDFLKGREVNVNFEGQRTREQAIATYKLAIFFAELAGTLASRLGGLYLKLAWLFREGEQKEEELIALDKAREYYDQAFLRERLPIGNMSQLTLEYLIGELYRRTNRISEALNYFSKVVGNPQAKQEKRILEMAREAWSQARETQKQEAAATLTTDN